MNNNIQELCPVCKLEKQDVRIWDYGERISLECARCGKFTITRTAAAMIERKGLNYKLSAWIRQQQGSGDNIPEINSGTLKDIEPALPTYRVTEKQLLLLRSFGRTAEFDGKELEVIPRLDFPLAWASDEAEFIYMLRLLIERNLVRRTDGPSDLNDSFVFKFEITAEGWTLLEKESFPMEHKNDNTTYDIFISHASEDKDAIARPLYNALIDSGISVWFDEAVIKLGDSLRRKIDEGLSKCRYGVVILSQHFLSKEWPQRELDGLVARETASGDKAVLPIWHELDRDTLLRYSPSLADRLAGRSEDGVHELVKKILQVLE